MLLIFAYNNGGVLQLAGGGEAAGASTTWHDRKFGERMGTRTIVYPGYHGRGRKY